MSGRQGTMGTSRCYRRCLCALILLCWIISYVSAWEWSDLVSGGSSSTLSIEEVSEMRVRDIKRRLSRNHGYSAEEVGRMLDKKELVQALAFEEEKLRLAAEADLKRELLKQGILIALVAVLLVMCWPLLQRAYEIALVNFEVYTDRKKLEARRCWELRTYAGMLGVVLMTCIDFLNVWLTASVILSWVMTSKYFFPVPSLPVRPAQLMGGQMSKTSLANYGINLGPMAVTWGLRFLHRRIELWTGKAMSRAYKAQRKAARQAETPEERATRRAARRAAKQAAREQQRQARPAAAVPPGELPPDWMQYTDPTQPREPESESALSGSKAHEEFLEQVEIHTSELDELD